MTSNDPTDPVSSSLATEVDASALWNLVPDALLAVEPSGRIVAVNEAATQLFGAETDQLIGCPVESLIEEASRANHVGLRNEWERSPKPRLMGSRGVFRAQTVDGRRIDVQVALNPVVIGGRQLTIAVIRDVTSDTTALRERASARDDVVQRLFGLGMSLRSVIPAVDASETAGRLVAVLEGMGDVVEALDLQEGRLPLLPDDER